MSQISFGITSSGIIQDMVTMDLILKIQTFAATGIAFSVGIEI